MIRTIVGVLTILHGIITLILGFAPNPNSTSYQLGEFWPDYAGSWLLSNLGVPDETIVFIAIGFSLLAGLCLILAGLGILEFIDFGELIEEFVFMAIILSLFLVISFFYPMTLIAIGANIALGAYMMFKG